MGGTQTKYEDTSKYDKSVTHQIVYEPEYCPYGVYISIGACAISVCTFVLVSVFLVAWYFTHEPR